MSFNSRDYKTDLRRRLKLYAVAGLENIRDRNIESLCNAVREAVIGGAGTVQLREKNMENEEYVSAARALLPICREYSVPLIINDNIEVCLCSGADGVHLGRNDGSIERARAVLGNESIIGATAHNLSEAMDAYERGADYLGVGAAFGSLTKNDASRIELSEYARITSAIDIPVVAIGGINISNIERLSGLGLSGAAVISGIFAEEDIRAAAAGLKALIE